jgi:hypothetical protein
MSSSISLSSPTATLLQTIHSATPSKSFGDRCIEDLSPDKISSSNNWSTFYLVAAGVTFVAFTALAVGIFAAVGLFAPVYVPFVGIGALLSAIPVVSFVKNLLESSQGCEKQANKYRTIQQHYNTLTQRAPLDTQIDLMKRGINWLQIPNQSVSDQNAIATLNPLLAQAMFLDNKIEDDLRIKEQLSKEANELVTADYQANRQTIYDLRNAALFAQERAMETKIEAAFVNAVLRKGDFNGTLEDVASLTRINYIERVLGNELNDSSVVNEFLTFKNHSLTPITFHDVKTMSVAQLGQRIAAALN